MVGEKFKIYGLQTTIVNQIFHKPLGQNSPLILIITLLQEWNYSSDPGTIENLFPPAERRDEEFMYKHLPI